MLVALSLSATVASVRAAEPDSLGTAPPARVEVVGGRRTPSTPARADTTKRQPWHEQPRFVMARSLVVPGWGQLHNHAWLKAVAVAGGEGWLGSLIVSDQHELDRLFGAIDRASADGDAARHDVLVNEYNSRLAQRLSRQWLLGGLIAYALVDAYVDAHFRGFEVEFRNDPALPAGTSPTASPGGGAGPGVRLALRWNF